MVGADDAVLAIGGAIVGVAIQGIADVASGNLSDWQHYTGAAFGGAVGGLAVEYTGGVGTGFLSSFTTDGVTQALEVLSGKQCEFSVTELLITSGIGALAGKLPEVKIPGLSAGRNNYNAIAKSIETKPENGTIKNVSAETAGKMLTGSTVAAGYGTAVGVGVGAGVDAAKEGAGESCGCK